MAALELLAGSLAEHGFPSVVFEPEGDLLIVRLSAAEQDRLLSNESLRSDLVRRARALGFSRLALELTASDPSP